MKAKVERMPVGHWQEYDGVRYFDYAVLAIEDSEGRWMLRLPMWQYDEKITPVMLQAVADAINKASELSATDSNNTGS